MSPDEIVYVDKSLKKSSRLISLADVQKHISLLGSTQNIQITKLLKSRKCLIVEGDDFKYIKKVAKKLGYSGFDSENSLSVVKLQGFSNSSRLKDSKWYFKNVIGEDIDLYVILDRDYFSDADLSALGDSFDKNGLKYHIWSKKELENLFLNTDILYTIIKKQLEKKSQDFITKSQFEKKLYELTDKFKQDVSHQLLSRSDYSFDFKNPKHLKRFSDDFEKKWNHLNGRLTIVSGKQLFSELNKYLNSAYSFSITIFQIIDICKSTDFDSELTSTIVEIANYFDIN
jgi:hypothetical protein